MNPPVLHLGIAGAGLVGRLLAHGLSQAGHRVSVFARAAGPEPPASAWDTAAFAALGFVGRQGRGSRSPARQVLSDWRRLDAALHGAACLRARGTVALGEAPEPATPGEPIHAAVPLSPAQLARLEPRLGLRADGWLVTDEALVDAPATLRALHRLGEGVQWHWGCEAVAVEPGALALRGSRRGWRHFDAVFDSRGLGACEELGLRLLRHDLLRLQLPGHGLRRPVRWSEPDPDPGRPAPPTRLLLPQGADRLDLVSSRETRPDDALPLPLAALREHLESACALMPSLAHASLVQAAHRLSAAGRQGLPWIEVDAQRVRINGLGAEGWRHAPGLVDEALARWQASFA